MFQKCFSFRNFARVACAALALSSLSMFHVASARAEAYVGALVGYGMPWGTETDVDPGLAYGATVGFKLLPEMSVGFTYLRDSWETSLGGLDYEVNHYLGELNFFSFFGLSGGLHAGPVSTKIGIGSINASDTDLGVGAHLGMDVKLTENVSIGGAGYWTYVTATDKYSTLNLLVPLKVWF
jgi:hypothetical protein